MAAELPKRKRLPHNAPSWVPEDAVFFVTVNCGKRGVDQLCNTEVAKVVVESLGHRQKKGNWRIHLCLLMPDHMHLLLSVPLQESMKKLMDKWKEYVAKVSGIRWQRDFFDHRLRNDENRVEKEHYIRMNPVRKGLVKVAEDWPFVWDGNAFR